MSGENLVLVEMAMDEGPGPNVAEAKELEPVMEVVAPSEVLLVLLDVVAWEHEGGAFARVAPSEGAQAVAPSEDVQMVVLLMC